MREGIDSADCAFPTHAGDREVGKGSPQRDIWGMSWPGGPGLYVHFAGKLATRTDHPTNQSITITIGDPTLHAQSGESAPTRAIPCMGAFRFMEVFSTGFSENCWRLVGVSVR